MRLLHTTDLHFKEFFDQDIPEYVILSHRWGENEVSFQEMQYLLLDKASRLKFLTPSLLSAEAKNGLQGHQKVLDFCKHAAAAGQSWVWIDTVCIDKASSAELSEAINSMFRWYQKATRCWVYLSDVRSLAQEPDADGSDFRTSQWWLRGWTLQELLAPKTVIFLDQNWQLIGTRSGLVVTIEDITGIAPAFLLNRKDISRASAATRMSWAAHRRTSRTEDIAYCLMGLFDVKMPLLYGEGSQAFRRLCIVITDSIVDDTILVHSSPTLFPSNPSYYLPSRGLERDYPQSHYGTEESYTFETWKRGVHIKNVLYFETVKAGAATTRRHILLSCRDNNGRRPHLTIDFAVGNFWQKATATESEDNEVRAIFASIGNKSDTPHHRAHDDRHNYYRSSLKPPISRNVSEGEQNSAQSQGPYARIASRHINRTDSALVYKGSVYIRP